MTHVVAEPCVDCKYTDCVDVCPVDAFREGINALVIDPDECIDCTLCVTQCPVRAIYQDADLPERWSEWTGLNARLSKVWPMIRHKVPALPGADEAGRIAHKRARLPEEPEAR